MFLTILFIFLIFLCLTSIISNIDVINLKTRKNFCVIIYIYVSGGILAW